MKIKFLFSIFVTLLLSSFYINGFSQIKVGCIGDSVTKGYGIKGAGKSYPEQLQALLGAEYLVRNFGHSGATLLANGHNPYIQTKEYQEALQFAPDIIVVALGLNDTDPRNWPNYSIEFEKNYSTLIDQFREVNPAVEVYVCLMTPIFSGHPRFLSGTRDWFDSIQTLIPKIAIANGAELIDNHNPLAARIDLFDDFLHPNVQGAYILASNVAKALVGVDQALSVDITLGSNMVLQRDRPNKIFGAGMTDKIVTVNFDGKTLETTVDTYGNWSVEIPSKKAGGPYTIAVQCNNESVTLDNILFGDVYLASGQSNMAFPVRTSKDGAETIDKADKYPLIRLFKAKNLAETTNVAWDSTTLQKVNDLNYFSGNWQVSSSTSVASFSAVAYSFAKEIFLDQEIPIGIIDISVGGSNTESWIPRKALENDNLLATYIHSWRNSDFIQDFCRQRGAENLTLSSVKNARHPYAPAYNFEAGMSSWANTAFKGVLWYQGESNAHNIELHDHLFTTLVSSWRAYFKQEDLPFYFVQLSSIERPSWPVFRNHQRMLSKNIPGVYMAVSSDVGDPTDVHPTEKKIIGQRLANLAKQHTYGRQISADSPALIEVKQDVKKLILTFSDCQQLKTRGGKTLDGLEWVDDKGFSRPVQSAKIYKNQISIPLPSKTIKHIRYAYSPYTTANLENETGTPVSTFTFEIK